MNTEFTIDFKTVKRVFYVMLAGLFVAAGLPMIQPAKAAADQLGNRSITMSDSSPSGNSTITTGLGSGTSVIYKVSFDVPAGTDHNFGSMVIDFCQENPIIGDTTCTRPTGTGALQPAGVTSVAGEVGGTGWTVSATTGGQIKLSSDGAHDAQNNSTQTFELTGITNPNTVHTFYARMYTYANGSQGDYANYDDLGSYIDYGGIALSTTNAITITARVQESLMFCVTAADPSGWSSPHDCTASQVAAAPPAITLGQGTPTKVLDASRVDTGTVYTQVSTNATSGAIIRMRNSNTNCGGLSADNGATCAIPAVGATAALIPNGQTSGNADFGLFVSASYHDASGGVGQVDPYATYNDGTNTTAPNYAYGMDNTSPTSVTSTYGSPVAHSSGPVYHVENNYVFAATPALTTPAGIYTANLSLICTGTF